MRQIQGTKYCVRHLPFSPPPVPCAGRCCPAGATTSRAVVRSENPKDFLRFPPTMVGGAPAAQAKNLPKMAYFLGFLLKFYSNLNEIKVQLN